MNTNISANIYLFKVNNRNTRKKWEICSKLTIKTRQWRRSGVFIVNFEHTSNLFLVFLLLTLKRPGRLLNVLCMFNLRPVSTGILIVESNLWKKLEEKINFLLVGFYCVTVTPFLNKTSLSKSFCLLRSGFLRAIYDAFKFSYSWHLLEYLK